LGPTRARREDLRRKDEHPAVRPIQWVIRALNPSELQGATLDINWLTVAEGSELKELVTRMQATREDAEAKPFTDKEQARFEQRVRGIREANPTLT
jgi:hypothetical protein